eukprot:862975-Heterocapsa_arctica.AAC.1
MFPLPHFEVDLEAPRSMSRSVIQRVTRHRILAQLSNDTMNGLNLGAGFSRPSKAHSSEAQ